MRPAIIPLGLTALQKLWGNVSEMRLNSVIVIFESVYRLLNTKIAFDTMQQEDIEIWIIES
jgi:hypothetical protein